MARFKYNVANLALVVQDLSILLCKRNRMPKITRRPKGQVVRLRCDADQDGEVWVRPGVPYEYRSMSVRSRAPSRRPISPAMIVRADWAVEPARARLSHLP